MHGSLKTRFVLRELEKLKDCVTSEKNGEFLGDVPREPGGTKEGE